jgi:transposase-like protein
MGSNRLSATRRELHELADWLERRYPGAAASLREGLEETITINRLGVSGPPRRTLHSANPCESMINIVRQTSRNVKHWRDGEMCLRRTAAGMLQAERQFQRIAGYRQLPQLAITLEQHQSPTTNQA